MKKQIICLNPEGKIHGVCTKSDEEKCCMCPSPSIAISIKDIDIMKKLLTTDGCNSKKQVLTILKHYY